jgi:hypothetical protein
VTIKIQTFRNTNIILSKYRKTRKNRIRQGYILTIKDTHDIIAQDEINKQVLHDKRFRKINQDKKNSIARYYNTCRKTNHNTRICQEVVDISSLSESE